MITPSLNVEAAVQLRGGASRADVQAASGSLVLPPWGRSRSPSGEHSNGRASTPKLFRSEWVAFSIRDSTIEWDDGRLSGLRRLRRRPVSECGRLRTSGGRRATWEATAACPSAKVDYPRHPRQERIPPEATPSPSVRPNTARASGRL